MKVLDSHTPGTEAADDPLPLPDGEMYGAEAIPLEEADDEETGADFTQVLYEIVETALLAVVIWLVVNFATARYVVEGQSMERNLHTGQFLIVSRLSYFELDDLIDLGEPERGDIVVFDFPGNPADDYVKRVIGLPGETVSIDDYGTVRVDGEALSEPYLEPSVTYPYQGRTGAWVVPQGSYFVLGDNRNSSSDSRSWGTLDEAYIVGKAWVSYWPPQEWGVIPHYDYATP